MPRRALRWLIAGLGVLAAAVILPPGPARDLLVITILALGFARAIVVGRHEHTRRPAVEPLAFEGLPGVPSWLRVAPRRGTPPPTSAPTAPEDPRLRGRVALASFFLGRDGREWTQAEIADVARALDRTIAWLTAEAAAWGAPVEFRLSPEVVVGTDAAPRTPHALEFGVQEHDSSLFDAQESAELLRAASGVAARLGYRDLPTLAALLASRSDADHVVWIVHSLSQGQSHFLDARHTGVPGLLVAACYAREGEPTGPHHGPIFADPVTYAHELLHAFGATDKYGGSTRRFARGEVTEREVMLLHDESLSRLRIDPLTAREVGWHGDGPLPEAIQRRTRRGGPSRRDG